MRLVAYSVMADPPPLRPAPHERMWMDRTREKYAYRCLPLAAANSHGWEILCPHDVAATWNGGLERADLAIIGDDRARTLVHSHFGHGILTFDVGYVFRTEAESNLWVTGPANEPKDAIQPLSGLVETDWSPYSFTMNWMFTRPGTVSFRQGEPFCFFFPVARGAVDACEPELHIFYDDAELARQYTLWRDSRQDFLADLTVPGSPAQDAKWQRSYFRGTQPDGQAGSATHQTRVRAKPFAKRS